MARFCCFRWHLLGNLIAHILLLLAYQIRIWMTLDAWSMYMLLPCGPLALRKAIYFPLKAYSVPMCSMMDTVGIPASSVDDFVFILIGISIVFWSCISLGIHRVFFMRTTKTSVQ